MAISIRACKSLWMKGSFHSTKIASANNFFALKGTAQLVSIRNLFLLLRHLPFPQISPWGRVVGIPSAFVPCGRHGRKRVLVAKCGKGSLLRGMESFERAIGRMHGRRLLCVGWQNERLVVGAFCRGVQLNALTTPLQYSPKSQFVSTVTAPCQHLERDEGKPVPNRSRASSTR